MSRVTIAGSRRHPDRQQIVDFVNSLPEDTIVVSGGAKGVDTWAEEAAKARGLQVVVHRPDLTNCNSREDFIKAYYARNKVMAEDGDYLVAFVHEDRKGGTENTIKQAKALGKRVDIILPRRKETTLDVFGMKNDA